MRIGNLLIAVFFLTSLQAVANIVAYTSSADFEAAISGSPTLVEDYSTFAAGDLITPTVTYDGITYTNFNEALGTEGLITNQFDSFSGLSLGAHQGNGDQYFFSGDTFDIRFAPVYAIGVFFNVNLNSGSFAISTPVGTATTGSATYDTATFVFAGLVSTTPFTSAEISSENNGLASYNIPEIVLAQVPEPVTMSAMLGAGLLAALLLRRRLKA